MNKCHICQKDCENLDLHYFKDHENEAKRKKYECEFCDKSYPKKGSLKYHIEANHNSNSFKCDICSKQFSVLDQLKNHLKLH